MTSPYESICKKFFFLFFLILSISPCTKAQDNGNEPTIKILIKAVPGLQYDLVRFMVKPGAKVMLSLVNTDDMSHNLLITRPGARLEVINAALQLAEKGPKMNFIPNTEQVLISIPVVLPGQVQSVSFTAPARTGVYPYVCTYPGHGVFMFGAMYVMSEAALPAIATDLNIPESRRKDTDAMGKEIIHADHGKEIIAQHPYPLVPPYLYRVFIEGASPAAIVVRLPWELSYCWDAGTCKLRFAWKGGFVDNTGLWKGHSDASAKILGDVFFRDNIDYPIRLGENVPLRWIQFKGYRLVDKYPEFHYRIDGIDIYELVHAKEDGTGLVRQFRIPSAPGPVWFYINHQDDAVGYEFSSGISEDGRQKFTPAEAKEFSVIMTSYPLVFQRKKLGR